MFSIVRIFRMLDQDKCVHEVNRIPEGELNFIEQWIVNWHERKAQEVFIDSGDVLVSEDPIEELRMTLSDLNARVIEYRFAGNLKRVEDLTQQIEQIEWKIRLFNDG